MRELGKEEGEMPTEGRGDRRAPEEWGRVEHPLFQPGVVLGATEEG